MTSFDTSDQRAPEPVAVVGIACRFPGADGPQQFWELLCSGTDAVGAPPAGRGELFATGPTGPTDPTDPTDPAWAGDGSARGGFLDAVDRFDPAFFGMSPREAAATDPQQRLILELCWEALEDARVRPEMVRGADCGVFVGAAGDDYAKLNQALGTAGITAHTATGQSRAMLANRVSHRLGLRGPSLTVDSAQSSALVAVHLAVQSLRCGESELAVAGGVQLNLAPEGFQIARGLGALSPDGRCFTFDARANGYVRGEGGGLVVLKPYQQAVADGDRVYAVILGSAVGNEGAGDTLTAPDQAGQGRVLTRAYTRAGVDPGSAQYVELHGTGTVLGDRAEAGALGAVLGSARLAAAPVLVGSVKTNIGHLEGAAGVAGLLKTVLSVHHRRIPPSLNFDQAPADIELDRLNLRVVTALQAWPRPDAPLVAGVTSVGMGGTDCHVVLQDAPQPSPPRTRDHETIRVLPWLVWLVSGRSEAALREQAARLLAHVSASPELDLFDLAGSLALTRTAFEYRAAVLGQDRDTLVAGLRTIASGGTAGVLRGTVAPTAEPPRCAVRFSDAQPGSEEDRELQRAVLAAVAELHVRGVGVDWATVFAGARMIDLPTYAFQRQSCWFAPARQDSAEQNPAEQNPAEGGEDQRLRPRAEADPGIPSPVREPVSPVPDPFIPSPVREPVSPVREPVPVSPVPDLDFLPLVREQTAAVLGLDSPAAVEPDWAFRELGVDSSGSLRLREALSTASGVDLPASVLFDHPTPRSVAARLAEEFSGRPAGVQAVAGPQSDDPIAIVGMGCRFPGGVQNPQQYWDLLVAGRDVIGDFPTDRGWDLDALYHPDPDHPGTSYTRQGGFLHSAPDFDAGFFGISPREAQAIDPQQRLLLETSWEALEHAGIDPSSLRGSRTGVFVGATTQDYGPRLFEDADGSAGHMLTGITMSVASGRLSYTLGLQGPALTVDTACSSSLVSVHLACASLRSGESSLALVGGVSVMPTPGMFLEFCRQRGLAADGRCKSFGAGADGTAWAEGAGVVVLERLSDARRNGHHVWAVVRGSAVNQDGASNGLTAPNGLAQQALVTQALADAGLAAADVDVVEAHGTGTTLGDPIEAHALLATYGRGRPAERPLLLGSVKSNMGHTQSAAGVAGLLKTVLALNNAVVPKTLHAQTPSPKIDWSGGGVQLVGQNTSWPQTGRPRRAGVSAFGISGTNAHVIVEQAPEQAAALSRSPDPDPDAPLPWLLSARTPAALRAQAERLHEHLLDHPDLEAAEVAQALAARTVFEHRAVAVGVGRQELMAGLEQIALGQTPLSEGAEQAVEDRGVVFVFPGQGSQWAAMGRELLDSSAVFAERIAECEQALGPYVDWSLTDVLRERPGSASLERVDVVQPVLWAMMVALAALWESCGVRPSAVVGHSQGEIAAATVAGALSLSDGARIVALRSQVLSGIAGRGGMMSIPLPADAVLEDLRRYDGRLSVAAANGPASTVVSGDADALEELLASYTQAEVEVRARRIPVDYASHSRHVEQLREELLRVLDGIEPYQGQVPLCSTVTAAMLDPLEMSAEYWFTNLRQPVRFEPAIRALLEAGHRTFVEVSPHAVLTVPIQETIEAVGVDAGCFGTLRRDEPARPRFLRSLAEAHTRGLSVSWPTLPGGRTAGRHIDLPTYPFQRRRYWIEPIASRSAQPGDLGLEAAGHPMVGAQTTVAGEEGRVLLSGRLSLKTHPWLADHAVTGTVLLPGAAFVELALAAGVRAGCGTLDELVIEAPLVLPETGAVRLQIVVEPAQDTSEPARRAVSIHSRPDEDESDVPWTRHAAGMLSSDDTAADADAETGTSPRGAWPPAGAQPIDTSEAYQEFAASGYDYGLVFQGLRAAWRSGEDFFAEVELPASEAGDVDGYGIHPALLDAALHAMLIGGTATESGSETVGPRLPFSWAGVHLRATGATRLRVRISPAGQDTVRVEATDAVGTPVVTIASLTTRPISPERLRPANSAGLYRVAWLPAPAGSPTPLMTVPSLTALDGLAELPPVVLIPVRAAAEEKGDAAGARAVTTRILALIQAWLVDERTAASRLVLATRDAVAVTSQESPDLSVASVWGLVRSVQSEHPDRIVLVDLDEHEASVAAVPSAVGGGESQLAIREGVVHAPRLVRVPAPPAPSESALVRQGAPESADEAADGASRSRWSPDGTVLITGGAGLLGSLVARQLVVRHGVRHLLLASRSGPASPAAAELTAQLSEFGVEPTFVACDVSDRAELAALLAAIPAEHPLTAVVHAAGAVDDGLVEALTAERLDGVFAPKADAAWLLHDLTQDLDLDAFVLFSSIAGVLGNPGQANYAAANVFLDALAQHRRAAGRPAESIAWGLWESASALTGALTGTDLARLARLGIAPLSSADGLDLFDLAPAAREAAVVAARLDFTTLRAGLGGAEPPTMLRALVRTPVRAVARAEAVGPVSGTSAGAGTSAVGAAALAALPADQREQGALELVRSHAAAVLGHAGSSGIGAVTAFRDLGVESLTAVELRNRLNAATGLRLPAALVFSYPNARAVAGLILAELGLDGASDQAQAQAVTGAEAPQDVDDDPIAIVGIGCRFPGGVGSAADLWDVVSEGRDVVGSFPTDRGWDLAGLLHPDTERPGTSFARQGGFLYQAADFDAGFFGMSPREALVVDPQQRLLLETSWEALEDAGVDPVSLRDSATGVYTGVMYHDYGSGLDADAQGLAGQRSLGVAGSVASGRVSYVLGLQGPAVSVDTACSSALVALHLASQALRAGECSLALAGGVAVMATPTSFVEFSRQGGLSSDGRCRSFASGADGTGWSEGAGVLVLERLSVARERGHRIWGVIRGSAVNQDGASNGLTAPNGLAQRKVIESALGVAGLAGSEVDVVEGHGTGTRLGDPVEVASLLATYGQGRPAGRELLLGSLKSNIGHAQAAAGVGGVIKMLLAMRHGVVPATLHVDAPSEFVDWSAGDVRLVTEAESWPVAGRPRRAGVSAFGVSGTNAHVILEQAPEPETTDAVPSVPEDASAEPTAWVLSARNANALHESAQRLHAHLDANQAFSPVGVGRTLAGRSTFEHRAVVVGADRQELLRGLRAVAMAEPSALVRVGVGPHSDEPAPKSVFVFPGQGSQWVGMGRGLLESSSVFAERIAECERALSPHVDWSLTEVLRGGALDRVDVVQPVLWAVMVALAAMWRSCGVQPSAVVGHSQGEIAAATVAGALSLEDGALIVARRSRLLAGLAGQSGGMLSIQEAPEKVAERLAGHDGRVSIAALNGPASTVVSGDLADLHQILADCEAEGVRARLVPVDYASHCAHVEAIKEDLLEALAGIQPGPAAVPFYSTVTAGLIDTSDLTAEYWYTNLRQPVRFEPVVRTLLTDGHHTFIESSPHPVLIPGIQETIDTLADADAACVPTLHRDEQEQVRFLLSLGEAYTVGQRVDWYAALPPGQAATDLPTYPFQRRRYWLTETARPEPDARAADPAETEFWAAVERQDATVLADTLDLDPEAVGTVLPALTTWHRRIREQAAAAQGRYRVQWLPHSEPVATARLHGTWLVIDSAGRTNDSDDSQDSSGADHADHAVASLCTALTKRGANPSRITLDVGTADRAQLANQVRAAVAEDIEIAGVISLIPLDGRAHPTCPDLAVGVAGTLLLIQVLADAGLQTPVWHLTAGAAAATAADGPPDPTSAQVWGLGRVAALEHPRLWGGLVDVPGRDADRLWPRLTALLAAAGDEDQLALRESGWYVRRLLRAPLGGGAAEPDAPARRWRPRGTALVTGATGALGPHIAQWLADAGAEHLVLVSRGGPDAPGADELLARLADRGVLATVESCDVSDRAALAALVGRLDAAGRRVGTVIHAAAGMRLDALADLSVEGLGDVVRAKTAGAVHLAELLAPHEPEFVFFSSIAGVWGSSDHGAYAAANAYLDAYAEQLRAGGTSALSVAWGVWGSDRLPAAVNPDHLRRQGLELLVPNRAFAGLRQALDHDETFVALADVDWERFAPVFSLARSRPLLDQIPEARRALAEADPASGAGTGPADSRPAGLGRELLDLAEADRDEAILRLVTDNVAAVLRHPSDSTIPADEAFVRLGFESLTAVELRNRLNQATGLRLPSTLVYDHPTPAAVAVLLRSLLIPAEAQEKAQEQEADSVTAGPSDPGSGLDRVTDEELMKLIDGELDEI